MSDKRLDEVSKTAAKAVSHKAVGHMHDVGPDLHAPSMACGMKIARDAFQETIRTIIKHGNIDNMSTKDVLETLVEELDTFPIIGE